MCYNWYSTYIWLRRHCVFSSFLEQPSQLSFSQIQLQHWNLHSSTWWRWAVLLQYLSAGVVRGTGRVQHQSEWRDSVCSLWRWKYWGWQSTGHLQWSGSTHGRWPIFKILFFDFGYNWEKIMRNINPSRWSIFSCVPETMSQQKCTSLGFFL